MAYARRSNTDRQQALSVRPGRAGKTSSENAALAIAAELPLGSSRGRCPGRRESVVEQELQDDAGRNRNQNVVATCLHPMVTTRRGTEVVGTPVIDHIVPVAVFGRKAIAPVESVVRARTTFVQTPIVVCATLEFTPIRLTSFVAATILLAACLFITTAVVAIPITLSEGRSARGQTHCHNGGYNCFTLHAELHSIGKCQICLAHLVARLVPIWDRPLETIGQSTGKFRALPHAETLVGGTSRK